MLCMVMNPDSTPHETNERFKLMEQVTDEVKEAECLFGFEQVRPQNCAFIRWNGVSTRLSLCSLQHGAEWICCCPRIPYRFGSPCVRLEQVWGANGSCPERPETIFTQSTRRTCVGMWRHC